MSYSLVLITSPVEQPVTLAEAKKQVEVADAITYHDDHLTRLIKAAVQHALVRTGRQLLTASYRLTIDAFPSAGGRIFLPLTPLRSVESVEYYDADCDQQTLATTVYKVLADREPGELALRYGQTWPTTYDEPDVVTVNYTVGIRDRLTSESSSSEFSSESSSGSPGETQPAGFPAGTGEDFEWIRHGILLVIQAYWLRDHQQPYDRLLTAAEAIFESHRVGDDFVQFGAEG